MAVHGRDEQPIHRALGSLEQIRRLGCIEAAPPSCDGELVMEWSTETEEALDRLAEGQTETGRHPAVVGRRRRGFLEIQRGRIGLRRVEVLQEARCENVTAFAKEDALLIRECEDPRQVRRNVSRRSAITSGKPARSQACRGD